MPIARRRFLALAAGSALLALPRAGTARPYPSRPLRWLVGFPPGGATDTVARLMGQFLSERFGQPVIIENRPGSAGALAFEAAARSQPDGHTLLLLPVAAAIHAAASREDQGGLQAQIAPVAGLVRLPLVLQVERSFPAQSIDGLIAHARRSAGPLNAGSSGIGTTPHMAAELFKSMTGIGMTHVPYRGEPQAISDLIGGRIDLMFGSISTAIDHIRAGRLRALAVTTAARSEALPEVPALGEALPGFDISPWYGVAVARHTPAAVVERLNGQINAGLDDPAIVPRLAALGATPMVATAAAFDAFVTAEVGRWRRLLRAIGA